jgi:K+-transporting ATPase ATPase C chain
MVESSASGLDPDITVPDALLQIPRVAGATGLSTVALRALVGRETTGPIWGFWGVAMVNVLQLNLALERELGKR